MTEPPAERPPNAGSTAPPAVEVRYIDGALWRRVATGAADQLVARGWAAWHGTGRRRHVALTSSAPISAIARTSGRYGTRVMRADGTGQRAAGQVLGERRSHLELIPPRL
jgi:hypothetical protein